VDLAVRLSTEEYPQKRDIAFSLFERIIGRYKDVLVTTKDKQIVILSFTEIFEHLPKIKRLE
jgi:hypothetical protein